MPSRCARFVVLYLLLLGAVALAYRPAWHGGMLWDDNDNVTAAELQSADGLRRIWLEVGSTQQYFPLLHTVFWLEHACWGASTLGYHLANIALHALAAALCAVILRRLGVPGAVLAAFVFALHPVHVESVAWITEQKNTFSAVIFLGAILAWIVFDERRSRRAYAAALLLFLMACLSKTSVVPLFGVLLVIAWWRRGKLSWSRDVLPAFPFAALGLGAGLFTAWVERNHVGATGAAFQVPPLERLQIAGRALWFYLGKLLWPVDLRFIYPRWELDPSEAWPYVQLAAWIAMLALLALLGRRSARARGPLAGMLVFTGLLVPVIGVVVHYYYVFSFVADHWQYLASLGVIALLSAGATLLANRAGLRSRLARAALCAALLGTLGGMTWQQCRIYTDAETHYRAMLAGHADCWLAHNNLGILLVDSGRVPEGVEHYEQALRLRPGYGEAHHNLGIALAKLGRTAEAIEHYRASLQAKPDAFESLFNLGNLYMKLGRAPEALAFYEQALRINPDASDVSNNLGKALILVGKTPEGIAVLEAALARRPDFAKGHVSLADALLKSGRVAEAIAHYEAALRLRPDDEAARKGLLAAQDTPSPSR